MKNFTRTLKPAFILLLSGIMTINAHAQTSNALDFDGVDDYVEIPYNSTFTQQITSVQLLVKINSATPAFQSVFVNGGDIGGGNFVGFGLFSINGFWTIVYGTGGGSFSTLPGPAVTPGAWTNIAGTYNGTTLDFYVNGVLVGTVPAVGIQPNKSLPIRLGAGPSSGSPTYFFGGEIDELSMWSGVLSPAKIATNMNGGLNVTQANLLAYYNFNEGIGNGNNLTPPPAVNPVNTLTDLTSNHLDGALNNFALTGNTSNWVSSSLVLPINLINFSGSKKDGSNLLQWSTASEQNSRYFEIQRSENGADFNAIGKVSAAGNSNSVLNYQYTDNQLSSVAAVYYYRLKMVDIDGSSKYSSIIFIKNSAGGVTTVYPNPAKDQITINIADKNLINTQAILSDLNGKVLQIISLNQSSTQVNISNYIRGMYILKFTDGKSIKIVKE